MTNHGNIPHFVSRQEEEKPVHLTECCLIPVLDWPVRQHKNKSLCFYVSTISQCLKRTKPENIKHHVRDTLKCTQNRADSISFV